MGALWVQVFSAAGSVAALAAAVGGLFAIGIYGRRATISIDAEATVAGNEVLMSARPSVRAVGVIRLRLDQGEGAWVKVVEIFRTPEGLADGLSWESDAVVVGGSGVRPLSTYEWA